MLVFVNAKIECRRLARQLQKAGINADAIHGDKTQDERMKALEGFKTDVIEVLVATDVAARGLDIVELPVVINYDVPFAAEDYIHRIGRTGRAGMSGLTIMLMTGSEERAVAAIEKLTKQKFEIRSLEVAQRSRTERSDRRDRPLGATPSSAGPIARTRRAHRRSTTFSASRTNPAHRPGCATCAVAAHQPVPAASKDEARSRGGAARRHQALVADVAEFTPALERRRRRRSPGPKCWRRQAMPGRRSTRAMSSGAISRPNDVLASASSRTVSIGTPRACALFAKTESMRGPATDPGQIALTRMPSPPSSIDSDFVNPITAHFDAA